MMKQTLAASVFAAGMLLAGAAMAQTRLSAPMTIQPSWQGSMQAEHHAERIGSLYADPLNTLYAHGYHGVQDMSLQNDDIAATAITPNGIQQRVTVEPESGQV